VADTADTFAAWLEQARVPEQRLTAEQRGLLQAAFRFRQAQGTDYYSTRLLGHFLLHCDCGLKVAAVARLLRISRPTASRQQALSARQAIQQAHHRMDGRPYGKLLPRYAGPILRFLLEHKGATRADLIDFIDATFAVRVSRVALYHFLKKFGLDAAEAPAPAPAPAPAAPAPPAEQPARPPEPPAAPLPATVPAPPFCSGRRATPAPS
jgi:hypothetical protein